MPIVVICPACGAKLNAPDQAGGQQSKCPKCSSVVQVPVETSITTRPRPTTETFAFVPGEALPKSPAGEGPVPVRRKKSPAQKPSAEGEAADATAFTRHRGLVGLVLGLVLLAGAGTFIWATWPRHATAKSEAAAQATPHTDVGADARRLDEERRAVEQQKRRLEEERARFEAKARELQHPAPQAPQASLPQAAPVRLAPPVAMWPELAKKLQDPKESATLFLEQAGLKARDGLVREGVPAEEAAAFVRALGHGNWQGARPSQEPPAIRLAYLERKEKKLLEATELFLTGRWPPYHPGFDHRQQMTQAFQRTELALVQSRLPGFRFPSRAERSSVREVLEFFGDLKVFEDLPYEEVGTAAATRIRNVPVGKAQLAKLPPIKVKHFPIPTSGYIETQKKALTFGNPSERKTAAENLGKHGSNAVSVLPFLISILNKETVPGVKKACLDALGEMGSPLAIPMLRKFAKDKYPLVSKAAIEALPKVMEVDEKTAPRHLFQFAALLQDEHEDVSKAAQQAILRAIIGIAGKKTPETVFALMELDDLHNQVISQAVDEAIESMGMDRNIQTALRDAALERSLQAKQRILERANRWTLFAVEKLQAVHAAYVSGSLNQEEALRLLGTFTEPVKDEAVAIVRTSPDWIPSVSQRPHQVVMVAESWEALMRMAVGR